MEKRYHHGDLKNALIAAGIAVLAEEGVGGLSLRKVAQRAGVSHAAPYAHYADKQALIAAISTAGYRKLYERLLAVGERHAGDPLRQLVEGAWAYVRFAQEEPDHFRITFSGAVELEHAYPALVEMTRQTFELVVGMVAACQAAGHLRAGPPDVAAVSVWGLVHGVVSLLLEGQISHTISERYTLRELLVATLGHALRVDLGPELLTEA